MPITVSTVYTKERLLRFNRYVARAKWPVWVMLGVCTLIVLGCVALLALLNALSWEIWCYCFVVLAIDALYVLLNLVVTPLLVKKSKNIGTTVGYTFNVDCFTIDAANEYVTEKQTVKYAYLRRAVRAGDEIYLFISRRQAYIVDVSALDGGALTLLGGTLATSLGPRKMKW